MSDKVKWIAEEMKKIGTVEYANILEAAGMIGPGQEVSTDELVEAAEAAEGERFIDELHALVCGKE